MHPLRRILPARPYLFGLIEASLVAGSYVLALYLLNATDASLYLEYEGGVLRIAIVTAGYLLTNYLFDTYEPGMALDAVVVGLHVTALVGVILLMQAALAFTSPDLILPQAVVLLGTLLTVVLITLWRAYIRPHLWNAFGVHQVLFVGANQAVLRLIETFRVHPVFGLHPAALLTDDETTLPAGILHGSEQDLASFSARLKPDRIIISEKVRDKEVLQTLLQLRTSGRTVQTVAQVYETLFGRVYTLGLEPYSLIFRHELSARPQNLALQSIYSNILSLTGFVFAFPLLIVIGLAVRLAGSPYVFDKRVCSGLHGIPFNRFTFSCEGRLGGFLRRFHLAGLPQAINLVRGEMTLIGPRPECIEMISELSALIPFYSQKSVVKPGLIGWSQLHSCQETCQDTVEALEYDLYYIKHNSLLLDAYIGVRALKSLFGDGPKKSAFQVWPAEEAVEEQRNGRPA